MKEVILIMGIINIALILLVSLFNKWDSVEKFFSPIYRGQFTLLKGLAALLLPQLIGVPIGVTFGLFLYWIITLL